ncbi:MAG: hypothetical protein J5993_02460 [Clostridia bacterium]|nr:hypothetical protein [Clostridia bacterium]
MLKMAVIGKDVSKSLSPKMHQFIMGKLGQTVEYDAVSIAPERFGSEIVSVLETYDCINVTIPFKRDVMPFLSEIKGDAKTFGAVNTVNTSREGYNTDGMGFVLSLQANGIDVKGKKVLVVGTGGVGRAVIKKLAEEGADVYASERDQTRLKEVYDEFSCFTPLTAVENERYYLVLNCTGVGMHKTEGISPVGEDLLSLCDVAYDLIYEPKKSEFLRIAERLGKQIVNGEGMLFYQAYYADCIFLKKQSDLEEAKRLFALYTEEV